jgi:F-type H+-transporting ATPase subunit delta
MNTKQDPADAWRDGLKAIGRRLQDQDLISPEQVRTLASLADQSKQLGTIDPAMALSVMATAYSAVEFERLSRQQAQAAGVVAWVRSAFPLTEEERGLVKRRLRERFGEEFILRAEIDPTLIGGLVVRAKNQVFDGSVAGRLDALGERLRTAVEEQRSPALELQGREEEE